MRQGCEDCVSVYTEFTGVQYSYAKADQDAFFVVIYYTSDKEVRQLFGMHNLKTVPYICVSK